MSVQQQLLAEWWHVTAVTSTWLSACRQQLEPGRSAIEQPSGHAHLWVSKGFHKFSDGEIKCQLLKGLCRWRGATVRPALLRCRRRRAMTHLACTGPWCSPCQSQQPAGHLM